VNVLNRSCLAAVVVASLGCITAPEARVAPSMTLRDAQEQAVALKDVTLRVRQQGNGDGPAVVFIHGYGSRLDVFGGIQEHVSESARTVSLDLRGFGQSERTAGDYGPALHARDIIELLGELSISKCILVGHSYGGGVAMQVAMQRPDLVVGLVLAAPLAMDVQRNSFIRWSQVPGLGEYLFSTSYRHHAGEKLLLATNDLPADFHVKTFDDIADNQAREGTLYAALATVRGMHYEAEEQRYGALHQPMVLLWGERDRVLSIRHAPRLLEMLPRATLQRLPNAGHLLLWDEPGAVIAAIAVVRGEVSKPSVVVVDDPSPLVSPTAMPPTTDSLPEVSP
jgi:pimeloyl-ACP methyl ester carboxylesterase